MKACGVGCDKGELEQFFKALDGRALPGLIAAGSEKTISMPCGGGAAPAGGAAAAEAPKEEKKEEAVEEVDMGGLFGDEDDY